MAKKHKCAVIGCGDDGLHRIKELTGRLYCIEHFKTTAHKVMLIGRALRAIERGSKGDLK